MEQRDITLQAKGDIDHLLTSGGTKNQSLKGFEDDYADIVEYIVKSTHRIWEEKGIGLIYTHYLHNALIHTAEGLVYGRDEWLKQTVDAIAAFPDIRLYADEVIWTGNDEEGFHTSHRITAIGHNTGYSVYGPPTGRKVIRRAIANCFVKDNRICEEWVVRDGLHVVQQLGLDVETVVRHLMAKQNKQNVPDLQAVGEIERVAGQTTPLVLPPKTSEGFDVEDFVTRSYHDIWNWRLLNTITKCYVEKYRCHSSSGREFFGLGDFTAWILSILQAFPDAKMSVEHVYWLENAQAEYRVAVRWSLVGTHAGFGMYGKPTGKRIYLMGITHHLIHNEQFVEEWTVFDELALLKQLYTPPEEASQEPNQSGFGNL